MLTEVDPFLPAVLVGERPPPSGCGPRGAFDDDNGRRLALAADLPVGAVLEHTDRRNLCSAPGDDPVPVAEAREAAHAIASFHRGRRVLMLGAQVATAFESALGCGPIPRFAALRHAGVELVRLPYLSDWTREPNHWLPGSVAGKIVRAEVDRQRAVRSSWCSIRLGNSGYGDAGDPRQDLIYHPTTGRLAGVKRGLEAEWSVGDACAYDVRFAGLSMGQGVALLDYLCAAAGRVPRWQASVPQFVGPHSIDVGARAYELALLDGEAGRAADLPRLACILGAAHDLHECLPSIGDAPGPVVRALRLASPAWRRLDDNACGVVAGLLDLGSHSAAVLGRAEEIVKLADRDCLAVERAVFFRDAPDWLGPRGVLLASRALAALARTGLAHVAPEALYRYDPRVLHDALRFGAAPAFAPSVHLLREN